jgi:hypothetical protein
MITFSTPDWSLDPSNLWLVDQESEFKLVATTVVLVVIIIGVLAE